MGRITGGDIKVIGCVVFFLIGALLVMIPAIAEMPTAWDMFARWWKYYLGAVVCVAVAMVLREWSGK